MYTSHLTDIFVGYRQTVQNRITRRKTRCLTRFSTVCLQNVLLKFDKNEKYHPTPLKWKWTGPID